MSTSTLRVWLLLDILGPMTKRHLMELTGIDVETMGTRLKNLRHAGYIDVEAVPGQLLPNWHVSDVRPSRAEAPDAHDFVRQVVDLVKTPLWIRKFFDGTEAEIGVHEELFADQPEEEAMARTPVPTINPLSLQSRPLLAAFNGGLGHARITRRPGSQDFRAIPSRDGDRRALRSLDAPEVS